VASGVEVAQPAASSPVTPEAGVPINSPSGSDTGTGGAKDDQTDGAADKDSTAGPSADDDVTPANGSGGASADPGTDPASTGGPGEDVLGGAKNDPIEGVAGNDSITGPSGDDHAVGDASDPAFAGSGTETVAVGGNRDDVLVGAGSDEVSGQGGGESAADHKANNLVDHGNHVATVDGAAGPDPVSGGAGHNDPAAGGGNDTVVEQEGSLIQPSTEGDIHVGPGKGFEFVEAGSDTPLTGADDGQLYWPHQNVHVVGEQREYYAEPRGGFDDLYGGGGSNLIFGGAQNDWLLGGGTDQHPRTQQDGDFLDGSNDFIQTTWSGAGAANQFYREAGADVASSRWTDDSLPAQGAAFYPVADFGDAEAGEIQLSAPDGDFDAPGGLSFSSPAVPAEKPEELRHDVIRGHLRVFDEVQSDAVPSLHRAMMNIESLTAGEFIL